MQKSLQIKAPKVILTFSFDNVRNIKSLVHPQHQCPVLKVKGVTVRRKSEDTGSTHTLITECHFFLCVCVCLFVTYCSIPT